MATLPLNSAEPDLIGSLVAEARRARAMSYAPFSGYHVGAAVRTAQGNVYSGTNIENASYGLTVCAERVAIFAAVAAEGGRPDLIEAVVVVDGEAGEAVPCGSCLQVIAEFGSGALVAFQVGGKLETARLAELLPRAFRITPDEG